MQMFNFKISNSSILRAILFLYLVFAIGLYGSPSLTIYPQLIGVLLSVVYFMSVLIKKSELFFPIPLKLLVIFLFISFLSTILFSTSLEFLFTIFQVILILVIVYNILLKSNTYGFFYWGVTIGCLLIIFFQVIGGRPLIAIGIIILERLGGTAGNVNDYAFILCTAINLLLFSFYVDANKKKMFYWKILKLLIILLFAIEITFFTLSKTGLIIMLFSFIIFSFNYIKKSSVISKFLVVTAVLILYLMVIPNSIEIEFSVFDRFLGMYDTLSANSLNEDGSTSQRFNLIIEGLRLWSERPLFGWGPGQYRWVNKVDFGYYSHNNFIEILVNFGLLGFLIFYSIHFYLLRKLFKLKKMKQRNNEVNWLLVMLFSLLIIDITFVTYYNKIYIICLAFILVNVKKLEKYFQLK
jgi:O-antigen ligase